MMTSTEIIGSVIDRAVASAKSKIEAIEAKGASYIPQILSAHQQVIAAERSGHQRSLDAAIACGQLLLDAKDAIKGQFKWSEWRSEYLKDVPQTSASLYMRIAKNKDRLLNPSGDDGRKLTTGVAKLAATGELSVRKAASLLANKKPRGKPPTSKGKGDEAVGKAWLGVLAPDELIAILRELHGEEWLKELGAKLAAVLEPAGPTNSLPSSTVGLRRV